MKRTASIHTFSFKLFYLNTFFLTLDINLLLCHLRAVIQSFWAFKLFASHALDPHTHTSTSQTRMQGTHTNTHIRKRKVISQAGNGTLAAVTPFCRRPFLVCHRVPPE